MATFIGSPTMNLYFATLGQVTGDGADIALGSNTIHVPPSVFDERPALATHAGRRIIAGFRPEDVEDDPVTADESAESRLRSTVDLVEALGSDIMVHFELDAEPVHVRSTDALQGINVATTGARASVCVARLTPKSRVALGQPIQVAVDATRMHFFDPDTHETIDGR